MAHPNGLESLWSTMKRAFHGEFHNMTKKHLQRYVNQFAEKHNIWEMDTVTQMQHVAAALVRQRSMYQDLTA